MGIYEQITQSIIVAIEDGTAAYSMPWHQGAGTGNPRNAITGREYNGINQLLLWATAQRSGWGEGKWATYRQWAAAGAQVRKGERSTTILLFKPLRRDDADHDDPAKPCCAVANAFRVFNVAQVDGFTAPPVPVLPEAERIQIAEEFCDHQGAAFWFGSDSAFYDPTADVISMPSFESFKTARAYYSVLIHELAHWTGAWTRLDRNLTGRFGTDAYAMEELIAELTAAFVGAHLGLGCEPRRDHAPYIATWLKVLRNDSRAILTAASRAQAAADYLIASAAAPDDEKAEPVNAAAAQLEVVAAA